MEFKKPIKRNRAQPAPASPHHDTSAHQRSDSASNPPQHSRLPRSAVVLSRFRRLSFPKKLILASLVVVLTGSIGTGLALQQHNSGKNADTATDPGEILENLEYQTVLPDGKSIRDLGGWKRVSPSESEPVFAYTDKIGDTPVSVSQQPLPESFMGGADTQVAELAKKFNATTMLDAKGTTVYIGTSAKGPQSAVLTKNGLLILIKSQSKLDDTAWVRYISSLN